MSKKQKHDAEPTPETAEAQQQQQEEGDKLLKAYNSLTNKGREHIRACVKLAKQAGNITRGVCFEFSQFLATELGSIPQDVATDAEQRAAAMRPKITAGITALRLDARAVAEDKAVNSVKNAAGNVRRVFETPASIFEIEEGRKLTGPEVIGLWAAKDYSYNLSRATRAMQDAQTPTVKTLFELVAKGTGFFRRMDTLLKEDPEKLQEELQQVRQLVDDTIARARIRVARMEGGEVETAAATATAA